VKLIKPYNIISTKMRATGITERYPDCRLDHHARADNSEIILLNDDNILCYTFSNLRVWL